MTAGSDAWARYRDWNDAIASVVFTSSEAGRPVYLDLEDEALTAIVEGVGTTTGDITTALAEACTATLDFSRGAACVLKAHLVGLDRWYDGSMLEAPPSLGLLALLSVAAERMRQSTDMRPHNFYGRLSELAGLDEDRQRLFTDAYRRLDAHKVPASRRLWESLNDWLEMSEGAFGTPTAHPLGHEHIGWALSQALVRQADRDKFVDLFALFGLRAHGVLATSEMATLIDEWMARRPCPATNHLERLWNGSPLARPRIAEMACMALGQWDGTVPEGQRTSVLREIDSVKVRVVHRTFPRRRMDISLVIPTRARDDVEELEVLDLSGSAVARLEMVPVASGWLGVSMTEEVDTSSLLGGEVRLRRAGVDEPLKRRARRLITLRWDEMLSAFVECERVQLGEESMVLTRTEIASRVNDLLDKAARPGFRRLEDTEGLPDGWCAFDGVQILSSIPREMLQGQLVDCYALQPLAVSQVVLHGGLRLPGHLRKWHHSLPPELRASSDDGDTLTASLHCTRPLVVPTPPDEFVTGTGAALVWDLAALELPDGDYELVVHTDGSAVDTQLLRLRSADNPARSFDADEERDPLANDSGAQGFGLFAIRSSVATAFRVAPDVEGVISSHQAPAVPAWWTARAGKVRKPDAAQVVRFPVDTEHSCIRTGAHLMQLPLVTGGMTSIEGVCAYCGLVKAYPTRFRVKRSGSKSDARVAPRVSVGDLPPVRTEHLIDWKVAFDAVCHVGSGSIGAMERITSQMDSTGLFADAFVRKFDVLGHIELERSITSFQVSAWTVNDPTLIEVEGGDLVLTGFRNERTMVALEDVVWKLGGTITVDETHDGPPRVTISDVKDAETADLASAIGEASQRPVRVVRSAARALASRLPPLSQARTGLPMTTAISARSYERWDPDTARFEPSVDAGAAGAFRLNAAGRTYLYRHRDDLGAMRATLGDARIVKYLAALDVGASLIGYAEDREILYVPLGADLPGLYGRAAALCAGRAPIENTDERILEYRHVPAEVAAQLNYLLMN